MSTPTSKQNIKLVIKSYIRLLRWFYSGAGVTLFAIMAVIVVVTLIPFGTSFTQGQVIDELFRLVSLPQEYRLLSTLGQMILFVIVLSILERTLWIVFAYFDKLIFFKLDRYFSFKFIEKASQIDIALYEDPESSNIIEKAKDIHDWRPREAAYRFIWIAADIIKIVSSVLIVLNFSVWAFLFVLMTTLPSLIGNLRLGKDAWGIWDANSTDRKKYWWLRSHMYNEKDIKEVRIFGARTYIYDILTGIFDGFMNKERKNSIRRSIIESILGNISELGIMTFWVVAIIAVLNGDITVGLLTFYTASMTNFSGGLNSFFRSISRQYEDSLYIIDYFKFIDLENVIISGKDKFENGRNPPAIEFRNVSFKYPNTEKFVLKNLNLKIDSGEKLAIVGINGAGKSTMVKLVCRFFDVTEGEILVNDKNIKDYELNSLYDQIGILFQDFVRYEELNVRQNIELGDIAKVSDQEKIENAVFKADAGPFIDEYKEKLEQILDRAFEGGVSPSGGQWQRIALARAFYRDAPILILDEPTSAIDAKGESEIFDRLFEFAQGKSVVIISHRFSTVRRADKIVVIDDGKIIEAGSHAELMAIDGKYADAFRAQAKGYTDAA